MPFEKLMIATGNNSISIYHWLVQRLPVTFTYEEFEELLNSRNGLTKATDYEVKNTLAKMRKLHMIGTDNIQNTYQETVYFIRDLYCQHYKKGKYASNKSERIHKDFK